MNNPNFNLKIIEDSIKVQSGEATSPIKYKAVIEHTEGDTSGNGKLQILIYTEDSILPLKIGNWVVEPIIDVQYDWGGYYFTIKLKDSIGDIVVADGKTSFGTQSSRNSPRNYMQEIFDALNKIIVLPGAKHWRANKRTTPAIIERIEQNDVVVIGGEYNEYVIKQHINRQGNIYILPTLYNENYLMLPYIEEFIQYAKDNKQNRFFVTKIGRQSGCLTYEQIALLFEVAIDVENVYLPKEFWNVLLAE